MKKHPSRARRRAALLALLVLAGPATAAGDQPGREPTSWMPPLPLDSENSVQSNPFCEPPEAPPTARERAAVRLTSGQPPLVHLKPAGSAVGLVPIGEHRDAPQRPSVRVVEAEPLAPAEIQTNPWAETEPGSEPTPVQAAPALTIDPDPDAATDPDAAVANEDAAVANEDAAVANEDAAVVATEDAAVAKEAVSFSLSDQPSDGSPSPAPSTASPADPPTISGGWQSVAEGRLSDTRPTVPQAPETTPGPWRSPALSATPPVPAPTDTPPTAESTDAPAAAPDETAKIVSSGGRTLPEPVQALPEPAARESVAAPREDAKPHQPSIVSPQPTLVQEARPMVIAESAGQSPEQPSVADVDNDRPVQRHLSSESPRIAASLARPPQPANAPQPADTPSADRAASAHRPAEAPNRIASADEPTSPTRASVSAALRYRPPVAIAAPPLAVERPSTGPSAAIVRPTVKTVAATERDAAEISPRHTRSFDAFPAKASSDADRPELRLNAAQVRSLTISGTLRRVQVADDQICQAIATDTSEVKLIGISDGHTQLSVWADPDDGGETRQQVFEIHVGGAVESAGQSMADAVRMLNQSIADAFPAARVTVRATRDHLVVSGQCASRNSATEILRMVRKTCLVPVRDELVIR